MSEVDRETPEVSSERSAVASSSWRRIGIYFGALLAAFLLGFVPAWLNGRASANERDSAQRELRVSRMQNALSAATIDASRAEYESARQSVSEFFTALRHQVDQGDEADLNETQRASLKPLLDRRDDLITMLARSDPASASRLSELYVAYRQAVSESGQTATQRTQ